MKTILSMLTVASVMLACSPPAEVSQAPAGLTPDDEQGIRSLIAAWDRSWAAGDIGAVTALYAADFVEARPTALEGPAAALELYQGFPITYTSVNSTVRRLEGVGDLAYVWVSFDNRFTRDSGERLQQIGNGLWVVKKGSDGQWRFSASAWQSNSTADTTGA